MKEMLSSAIHRWSRRRLLKSIPGVVASAALPAGSLAGPTTAGAIAPFSQFTDVAQAAGLTKVMPYGEGVKATYLTEIMGGGCAFFDYDNDGWMDIFILGGRLLEGIPPGASNRLYRNNRDGTFTDVTEQAGLLDAGWAVGVCVGDYNNDGFEDLFVTYYGQNRALPQQRRRHFYRRDGARPVLLHPGTRFGSGCTFVDYNRDGRLDLFVSNYARLRSGYHAHAVARACPTATSRACRSIAARAGCPLPSHLLYRNNGDGTFTDVSKRVRHRGAARILRPDGRCLRRRRGRLARHLRGLRHHPQPAADEQPRRHLSRRSPDARRRSQRRRQGDGRHGRRP